MDLSKNGDPHKSFSVTTLLYVKVSLLKWNFYIKYAKQHHEIPIYLSNRFYRNS